MIYEIFLILIALGVVALVPKKQNVMRLSAFLVAGIAGILCYSLYQHWQMGYHDRFIYHWVSSAYYPIDITLFSTPQNYVQLLPFGFIATIVMFFNVFYSLEEKRLSLNAQICLLCSAIILLFCSQNTIQLLTGACAIDIFSFYIINDSRVRRRFIFYNLLADMGLVMLFALIWGYLESNQLTDLVRYKRFGAHKDLLCLVLLVIVFIKMGLFMFHSAVVEWQNLTLNRIMTLLFLSTPLVGFVLLQKLQVLLPLSDYSYPMIKLWAGLSMAWGFSGCIMKDDIRAKGLYFNMMYIGFVLGLFAEGVNPMQQKFLLLLIGEFLLQASFLILLIGASNETLVSSMGNFIRGLKLTFVLSVVVIMVIFHTLNLFWAENHGWTQTYALMFLIGSSHVLRQVYWGNSRADERVLAHLKNANFVYLSIILATSIGVFALYPHLELYSLWALGIFVCLLWIGPLRFTSIAYRNETLQNTDIFAKIYQTLIITPILILGRILWLTIDFLIIERTVIYSLRRVVLLFVQSFQKIHNDYRFSYPLFYILGIGVLSASFYLTIGK